MSQCLSICLGGKDFEAFTLRRCAKFVYASSAGFRDQTIIVVTTLPMPNAIVLTELYGLRWQAEVNLRHPFDLKMERC